ncbi:MAG: SLC26A/SulP transporter family protein [Rhodospirillales bacterium]|nr:SLC26A/SulP transporter family protein [Rhodospirillales bacterium]
MGGDGLRNSLPNAVAGVVVGMLAVVNALAYAGLIYSGPLAPGLLIGTSALLAGAAASTLIISLLADCPELVSVPLISVAVVYALIPAALGAGAPGVDPREMAHRVAAISGLASLVAGVIYWLLGRFRLGALARFLPYPVVGGFNAGLGWLLFLGGITLGVGGAAGEALRRAFTEPVAAAQFLAVLGSGLALVAATRRWKHWAIVPAGEAAIILGFHAIRLARGVGLAAAGRAGWLLGPFAPGRIWSPPDWSALGRIAPAQFESELPVILAIVLIGATTAIMMLSGIEIELDRSLDTNTELRVTGVATLVAGVFGGLVGAPSLASTSLAQAMGSRGRSTGVIVAAVCALTLTAGTGLLAVLPRCAIGALLVYNGGDRLIDRVWLDRRRLPPAEWGVVLLVLLAVIFRGLLAGLALGLGLALLLFVLDYRQVSVLRLSAAGAAHRSSVMRAPAEDAALRDAGAAIRLLRLQGYLFFLNVTALAEALPPAGPPAGPRFVIVDFRAVAGMDSSAAMTLRRVYQIAHDRGFALILTGLSPRLRARFDRLGLPIASPGVPAQETEDRALRYAEARLLEAASATAPEPPASFAALLGATLGEAVAPERVAPYLDHATLSEGAVLIRQGEASDTMSLIASGRVAVRLERPEGPLRLATAGPGVVMGEVGFCTGVARTATVLAETETRVETLSRAGLARMEAADPDLAIRFHRLMAHVLSDKLAASNRQQAQSVA